MNEIKNVFKKIFNEKNIKEKKIKAVNDIIDNELFKIFSSISYINFDIDDVIELRKLKKDISLFFNDDNVYQNSNVLMDKISEEILKEDIFEFDTIEMIYTYKSLYYVVDMEYNWIEVNKEDVNILLMFEKKYPTMLKSIIKAVVLPHNNIYYSSINFIKNYNDFIILDKKLNINNINELENKKINRKYEFINIFFEIIDKYINYINCKINEYIELKKEIKKFNLLLIKEDLSDKYENLNMFSNNGSKEFNEKELRQYIEKLEEIKIKFENIFETKN